MTALTGTGASNSNKTSLVFLYNVTKDNINVCQTCNLIFSLVRNNPELAEQVAGMVFYGVKQTDFSMHFFRLLTLLTEFSGGPSGMPCFTNLVMHKVRFLKSFIFLDLFNAVNLKEIYSQSER